MIADSSPFFQYRYPATSPNSEFPMMTNIVNAGVRSGKSMNAIGRWPTANISDEMRIAKIKTVVLGLPSPL